MGILLNPDPTASSTFVLLAIQLLFTAVNDDKVGTKYGESKFNIMYRGIPLGQGKVPEFYESAHRGRQMQTTVAMDRANLCQVDVANLGRDVFKRRDLGRLEQPRHCWARDSQTRVLMGEPTQRVWIDEDR